MTDYSSDKQNINQTIAAQDKVEQLQARIDVLETGLTKIAISEFLSVEDLRWEAKKTLKGGE